MEIGLEIVVLILCYSSRTNDRGWNLSFEAEVNLLHMQHHIVVW